MSHIKTLAVCSNSLQTQGKTILSLKQDLPSFIQKRYRKPKWMLPRRAPSKPEVFKKNNPTEADIKFSQVIYENYNASLRSISAAFQDLLLEEIKQKEKSGEDPTLIWDEEKHHKKCIAYNDAENQRLQKLRLEKQLLTKDIKYKEKILKFQELSTEQRNLLEKEIENVKRESKNWITLENMEQKIIEALQKPVTFNFSVARDGKIHQRLKQ